ncbi:MAG TPA: hypothetical protein VFM13_02450 [Gaiellaceae bacterium]|nr:hypothetical protein [Gaiellaceae bacterium]
MTDFISGDELLAGLPARRANMLVFAIRNRTAQLMARSRQATALILTRESAEAREHAFLAALSEARDASAGPTVQDLERYAPGWRELVPADPSIRAAALRLLGERFLLPAARVPALREALGADDPAVRAAYRRLYDIDLKAVYAVRVPLRERMRWQRARIASWLEDLPPFWTAFALTLTGTVGTTTLAVPIATAAVGPAAGVATLVALALVTTLTLVGMSEAVTRNGPMHYGGSYLGRLVADFLGSSAASIFTLMALAAIVFALLVRFLGFAATLGAGTAVPAAAWAALLFVVNLYYLRRGTFESTLAATLAIGAVNVAVILGLSLLTLPHVRAERLSYAHLPRTADGTPDAAALGLLFGVALGVYARHISVGGAAKVVLPRDPSGRSLVRGGIAGLGAAAVLSCLWVAAVNGTVAPEALVGHRGTGLAPLADVSGPAVHLLGGLFAVLAMGLGSIAMSLALFYHVHEWLPPEATERVRFVSGVLPVVALFALAEWLLVTDRASFTGAIGFVNSVTGPALSGVFPILLLAASRRKGDYVPGRVWGLLNHPVVSGALYALFTAMMFAYAIVLWDDPVPRLVAGAAGLVLLGMTARSIAAGAFRPQLVVELRTDDRGERAIVNVTDGGRRVDAEVEVVCATERRRFRTGSVSALELQAVRSLSLPLRPSRAASLKVWLHRVAADGRSRPLAGELRVDVGSETEQRRASGTLVVPIPAGRRPHAITISGFELD